MEHSGIYVETLIRGSIAELWEKTQQPHLHQRWDLRFSTIDYLPRTSEAEPQRFLYTTRLGLGLSIAGGGESTGTRDVSGERTSALKFWSDDPKSLIRTGSGYWRYVPGDEGIRFFTWYDYETRFGRLGELIDRWLFRPAIGWATAWSFDRLRLWIEKRLSPETARNRALLHAGIMVGSGTTAVAAMRSRKSSIRAILATGSVMMLIASQWLARRDFPRAGRCARAKRL
jgi:hypothetical protein